MSTIFRFLTTKRASSAKTWRRFPTVGSNDFMRRWWVSTSMLNSCQENTIPSLMLSPAHRSSPPAPLTWKRTTLPASSTLPPHTLGSTSPPLLTTSTTTTLPSSATFVTRSARRPLRHPTTHTFVFGTTLVLRLYSLMPKLRSTKETKSSFPRPPAPRSLNYYMPAMQGSQRRLRLQGSSTSGLA